MTTITDQIAAWDPMPAYDLILEHGNAWAMNRERAFYQQRLRTADAILERVADVSCACDLIGCEHDDARAYLAAREGER